MFLIVFLNKLKITVKKIENLFKLIKMLNFIKILSKNDHFNTNNQLFLHKKHYF
jgi:hypothetical protein